MLSNFQFSFFLSQSPNIFTMLLPFPSAFCAINVETCVLKSHGKCDACWRVEKVLYLLNPSLILFLLAVSFLSPSQLLEAGILLTFLIWRGSWNVGHGGARQWIPHQVSCLSIRFSQREHWIMYHLINSSHKKSLAPSLTFLFQLTLPSLMSFWLERFRWLS